MFEQVGLPRMAGRIFGWLLISHPSHQSHSELAEVLQASKGSISMMARLLMQLSLIERVVIPGDRRDYFQIKPNAWSQVMQQQLIRVTAFRKLAEQGLQILNDAPVSQQQRLQEMHDIHTFWEHELPLLYQRWEQEQAKRQTAASSTRQRD